MENTEETIRLLQQQLKELQLNRNNLHDLLANLQQQRERIKAELKEIDNLVRKIHDWIQKLRET